jgi:hypothetical protein
LLLFIKYAQPRSGQFSVRFKGKLFLMAFSGSSFASNFYWKTSFCVLRDAEGNNFFCTRLDNETASTGSA